MPSTLEMIFTNIYMRGIGITMPVTEMIVGRGAISAILFVIHQDRDGREINVQVAKESVLGLVDMTIARDQGLLVSAATAEAVESTTMTVNTTTDVLQWYSLTYSA